MLLATSAMSPASSMSEINEVTRYVAIYMACDAMAIHLLQLYNYVLLY